MTRTLTATLVLSALLTAGPAHAGANLPRSLQGVGFDQKLNAQVPPELTFRDEAGRTVRLGDYFKDRPIILVLAYFRCPMLCTQVLNGTVDGLLGVPFEMDKDFTVLTVSFDAREKPDLAAAKKQSYVRRYGRPGAEAGWHFLTGDEDQIHRLTEAVGFRYGYDPRFDQFAHASGIMVLTPHGRISRYLYGIDYKTRDLRLALVEASENRIGSPVDQVLLYCFHYDPAEGKYGAAVMNILRAAGALTVLCIAGGIVLFVRREKRRARQQTDPAVALTGAVDVGPERN